MIRKRKEREEGMLCITVPSVPDVLNRVSKNSL